MAIKITSNFNSPIHNTSFYFDNMDDCNKFLYVFKGHMCNVPWNKPEHVDSKSIPPIKIIQNPKQSAENNLSWGFNACRFANISETPEQLGFIENIIKGIEGEY